MIRILAIKNRKRISIYSFISSSFFFFRFKILFKTRIVILLYSKLRNLFENINDYIFILEVFLEFLLNLEDFLYDFEIV